MDKKVIWKVKEIANLLKTRQNHEFDGNFIVSGERGNGKSTLINKILYKFNNYRPFKQQVYSREDVIELLTTQKKGICFDDEAINSGYKRNFYEKGQQELIRILTAYRDNYNVYASAIPNFFNLDKDLRDLCFLHFHVIERGIAVVHMPLQGRLYSKDKWDSNNNLKIEERYSQRLSKGGKGRFPYHKLTTFRGYILFKDMTPKQKDTYRNIKSTKRRVSFENKEKEVEKTIEEKLYDILLQGKLNRASLITMCNLHDLDYLSTRTKLNKMLREHNIFENVGHYIKEVNENEIYIDNVNQEIRKIIPDII